MANRKPKTASRAKKTKTQAAKPAASVAPADIRMIPLDQLSLSPRNVRKVQASAADDAELFASIRENGIKQNLIAYPSGKDVFLVDAGGRRLKALKQLAEEGHIRTDHPIACLIEEESDATVTSTTENLQRAAMHPADQFDAFAKMIGEGRSEDEIALKFGVGIDLVRRRLKLARVAPDIVDAFRGGDVTLECVMAFTLTDNHDRQLTVWNAVKDGYHVHPQAIKRQLTESAYAATSRTGLFVGIEAYEAAGGVLLRDLFDDQATAHMENPELLERLAVEKLQEAARAFEGDWKWTEIHLELDHGAFRSFGRVAPQDVHPDPDLLKEEEVLSAREQELAQMSEESDLTEEEIDEYHAIASRLAEIEDLQEARRPYAEEDRAVAGVVLTIGYNGALDIEKGLVRPEDIPEVQPEPTPDDGADCHGDGTGQHVKTPQVAAPTSSAPLPVSDPAASLRKADGVSASLAADLRATRQHILRAHLSADYEVAFDAMLYALCEQAHPRYRGGNEAINVSINPFRAQNRDNLHADTVAQKMLEAIEADLPLDWMDLKPPEDFRAMSALPVSDKQALFAWATGLAIKPQLSNDNQPSAIIEDIGTRLDVDVAACWRPAASTYWSYVNKAHSVSVARDLIGEDYAGERARERKPDLVAAMERSFAETAVETDGLEPAIAAKTMRWLPDGMAFDGVTEDQLVENAGQDDPADPIGAATTASADMPDEKTAELPHFLTGDAA